mgnify:CR=1 FL=1
MAKKYDLLDIPTTAPKGFDKKETKKKLEAIASTFTHRDAVRDKFRIEVYGEIKEKDSVEIKDLSKADCVILRQVLQHLSNAEIQSIVEKLNNFKYIILTEHLPEGEFSPNKNIISGQGIRLKKRSGVNLLSPPFNLKVKEEAKLLLFNLGNGKGVIATTLYRI